MGNQRSTEDEHATIVPATRLVGVDQNVGADV